MMTMSEKGSSFVRIVVLVVFVICMGVLVQKAYSFTMLYLSQPTVTSISIAEDKDLRFPAITLCQVGFKPEVEESGVAVNCIIFT